MTRLDLPEDAGREALVGFRRLLHRHCEVAFTEIYAAALIRQVLGDLTTAHPDIDLRAGADVLRADAVINYPDAAARKAAAERAIGFGVDAVLATQIASEGTAVVLDIPGNSPGPLVGLRFDIDGLPVVESTDPAHLPTREGFACTDGVMHACGHDGHTAMGLVLARRLAADRDFAGTVRLIFQPAEESVRGATAMIAAGVADGIAEFYGLHLGESLPLGTIAACGPGLMATVKFQATMHGANAHAAGSPQLGRNAVAAAATAVLGILALSRDSRGNTVTNVGRIEGGASANTIPDRCHFTAEVRSVHSDACDDLFTRAEAAVAGAAAMWGCTAQMQVTSRCRTFTASEEAVEIAHGAVHDVGATTVLRSSPMNASDDLAEWALETQQTGGIATFLIVGASSPGPHHSPTFDVAEDALTIGADWLEAIVRRQRR